MHLDSERKASLTTNGKDDRDPHTLIILLWKDLDDSRFKTKRMCICRSSLHRTIMQLCAIIKLLNQLVVSNG